MNTCSLLLRLHERRESVCASNMNVTMLEPHLAQLGLLSSVRSDVLADSVVIQSRYTGVNRWLC